MSPYKPGEELRRLDSSRCLLSDLAVDTKKAVKGIKGYDRIMEDAGLINVTIEPVGRWLWR